MKFFKFKNTSENVKYPGIAICCVAAVGIMASGVLAAEISKQTYPYEHSAEAAISLLSKVESRFDDAEIKVEGHALAFEEDVFTATYDIHQYKNCDVTQTTSSNGETKNFVNTDKGYTASWVGKSNNITIKYKNEPRFTVALKFNEALNEYFDNTWSNGKSLSMVLTQNNDTIKFVNVFTDPKDSSFRTQITYTCSK